ncbi:hypothetical protein K443DRAFT_15851 [Laccaria amethystina LaAM-08-1]|uniref:Uncharacterized protein n=1 Tax=Laccaria amethystina LaAM-08-1 TaxID=1095629 RepID=A0A0C9WPZ0_9AGAR|nr:hypothetical protein K443DRAFT_15851 [Laccaria amethystina LaAM-08-1]
MPEKKPALKKQPVTQAPPAVSPPALASTTTAAPSSPPPVSDEGVTKLIVLVTSSPNLPLGLVWKHAFEQGSQEGFKRGAAFFKDMDIKQAFRDGADQGQIIGILAKREEWESGGHGPWCLDMKVGCFSCDVGISEGHTCTNQPTKVDVMVQVDFVEAQPQLIEAASQTDPPPLFIDAEAQAQPLESKSITNTAAILAPSTLDWSEDASSIPVILIFPNKQAHCDFSALRTTYLNPFGSLARWNGRSHFFADQHNVSMPIPIWRCRAPPQFPTLQTATRWHHPHVTTLATLPSSSTPPVFPVTLDWDADPCLSYLSRALKALGWICG